MSVGERLGVHIPNSSAIPFESVGERGLAHSFPVVMVFLRLGQEEYVFVGTGRAILYGFRLAVGLVPDDIRSEKPPIALECKCKFPWNSNQIFWLQTGGRRRAVGHAPCGILFVGVSPSAIAAGISVTDIKPKATVGLQNAADLPANRGDVLNVLVETHLRPDLLCDSVVS